MTAPRRPSFIANFVDIQKPLNDGGFADMGGLGSRLGEVLGLTRLGIHVEVIPPGSRTSFPHAESEEEEFIFVLDGRPDVWLDGIVHELNVGDAVAFPAGTGIAHTFLNNSDADVQLLVVGEKRASNRINYPLNPERNAEFAKRREYWDDAPKRELGPHDGKAKAGTRK